MLEKMAEFFENRLDVLSFYSEAVADRQKLPYT